MPLINYICSCGEVFKKYYKSAKDALSIVSCKCGAEAKKTFGNISSSHLITIDNGLMAKKIEVSPDIMQINDERSAKDYSEDE